jgi:hypothetical protein
MVMDQDGTAYQIETQQDLQLCPPLERLTIIGDRRACANNLVGDFSVDSG